MYFDGELVTASGDSYKALKPDGVCVCVFVSFLATGMYRCQSSEEFPQGHQS